eukprot:gene11517-24084_t
MSNESEQYDAILTQLAGRLGGLDPLLDTFFGFLHRKTDFYVEYDPNIDRNAKMGFPVGVAEKMLLKSFHKLPMKIYDVKPSQPTQVVENISPINEASISKKSPKNPNGNVPAIPAITETGKQIPIGNGGICDKYYWIQTLKDATVYIDVPLGTRSKDIICTIKPRHLHVAIKGGDMLFMDGNLDDAVKTDDSMWSLVSGEIPQLVITLEKTRDTWWKSIIIGDPEIDTTK